jgi:uroporphyrinogen III methyltransferase/synthase
MTPAQGTTTAAHKTAHKTSRKTTRAKADVSAKTAATAAPQKAATSTVKQTRPLGHVTFVGVGPGDPALLTLAGRDVLANADAVVVEGPEHDAFLT